MALRTTPPIATWILKQFGSIPDNESAIGDLIEQYQRGKGSIWYWRQVLAIVIVSLFREIQGNKRKFLVGLVRTWCVWAGLTSLLTVVAMVQITRIEMSPELRQVFLPAMLIILSVLKLLAVGAYSGHSSNIHPRTMLLAFVTSYAMVVIGSTAVKLLTIAQHQQSALGIIAIRELVTLPLAAAILLIGGLRGIPLLKGEGGP